MIVKDKSVHSIVLDAGPIIRNDPSVSTLLAESDQLLTVPAVLSEIKDQNTRSRVELTLLPFLTLRTPSPASIKVITDFAKKIGDFAVLSTPDIQILSLAYELECERNGGDWRLRKAPGQKRINDPAPARENGIAGEAVSADKDATVAQSSSSDPKAVIRPDAEDEQRLNNDESCLSDEPPVPTDTLLEACSIHQLKITATIDPETHTSGTESIRDEGDLAAPSDEILSDSSDSEGWITPSNLKRHQLKDAGSDTKTINDDTILQVAVLTTDFAMQNVLLSMGLNLMSSSMQQIRNIKTHILRCYACFQQTKDMTKQFCSRCGKPTLNRVSCSIGQDGLFRIHLKKNMQWNHRGDRFSIPKPVPGSAHGKKGVGKGGGKGGWGRELILAEDQKEYKDALQKQSRNKESDLMDPDYLPGILTGQRQREGERIKIGGGRNINAKKR